MTEIRLSTPYALGDACHVGAIIHHASSRYRLSNCERTGQLTVAEQRSDGQGVVVLEAFQDVELAFRRLTALRRAELWLSARG